MRAVIALGLLLAACAKESPVAVDSGCDKLQRKDWTDPGMKKQNRHNKEADLGNELWWRRDCGPINSGLKAGPK